MFEKARRTREVFRLTRIHSPAYPRVFHCDLNTFRDELVRALTGLIVGLVAALIFVSVQSLAVLVSALETQFRFVSDWGAVAGWLVIAIRGLIYAGRALRSPVSAATFTQLLQRDLAAIERDAP